GLTYLNAVNPTPNVSLTYDPYFVRMASMTDGAGATTYTYNPSYVDGAQQLAQECFTATGATVCSHTIVYGYDALARPASRQIAGSGAETFQYDAISRVINHSSDLGAFQLTYLGQTSQVTVRQLLPATSSLKTTWSYLDNAHDRRLSGIANTGLTASQFTNFTFETSPENSITGITQASDATVAEPNPSAQAVSFNNLNQITQASGQAYSYDANGNLLSDGNQTYSWDAENRLVGITYASQPGKQTQFAYDGLGRRTEIDDTPAGGGSAVTSKYIWCRSKLCQARDASYAVSRSYFDEGEYRFGAVNPSLYYGIDQIGSVRRAFESASNAPAYDYDPWGNVLQATTSLADFGYAGMFTHPKSELGFTWLRAYSPKLGRWLSRDPLGEDANQTSNLYAYVDNSPLANLDPTGGIGLQWPPGLKFPWPQSSPNACPIPGNMPDLSGPLFNQDSYDDYPGNTPPYKGVPNSTVRGGTQSRTYGPDGYPQRDRDTPHPDEKGIGSEDHVHDWTGRSHEDRGPGRAPQDGDPPIPRGANK
ncbi:RHS repeat-associated core domain-containing protein, partial [Rhizobium rhizogenes]|uniref:RHS repeat-associated core domain-containing protein n=1 Tax=Rhizobium rhizogenes TaxID=359 RepID=UPI000B1C699A